MDNFFGSSMQLLSVENLSFAAEVTAVLLFLAFAWPQKKVDLPPSELEVQEASSCGLAKQFFLQSCMHRGLYLQLCRERQNRNLSVSSPLEPFVPAGTVDEAGRPNVPLPWQDRLTGLPNRNGFDAVLNDWLAIEPKHRGASCLTMVTLSEYSELVSVHGAMVTEQAIQRIANQLAVSLSCDSLIAKYLPDRFVVLHFSSGITACFKAMEILQKCIAEPGFFNVNGHPLSLATLFAIADLEGDASLTSRIDVLEEGTMDAEASGQFIVAKVEGTWTDSPNAKESEHPSEKLPKETDGTQENQPLVMEKIPSKSKTSVSSNTPVIAETSKVIETGIDDAMEVRASNDISAVANADDIAALFEQINLNKSNKQGDAEKAAIDEPITVSKDSSHSANTTSNAAEVDVSEPACQDDIAALFASTKTSSAPSSVVVPNEVSLDLNEAATADDIASLFATVKSAAKQEDAGVSSSDVETKTSLDLSEAASADEIAALFATVKSTVRPVVSETQLSKDANADETSSPQVVPHQDLTSSASNDDIEALFAALKK